MPGRDHAVHTCRRRSAFNLSATNNPQPTKSKLLTYPDSQHLRESWVSQPVECMSEGPVQADGGGGGRRPVARLGRLHECTVRYVYLALR